MTLLLLLLSLSASASSACGDPERLTTEAMLGLLDSTSVACLQTRLQVEPRPMAEHTWHLLLVDALAKGKHRLWRKRLREREQWRSQVGKPKPTAWVDELDCTDVDVYMANIRECHVRAKAKAYREALARSEGGEGAGGAVDLGACEDVARVAEAAERGELSGAQARCLMHHLRATEDEAVEQAIVMILLEDALARDGDDGVDALMDQLLHSMDCGDPAVYLEHEGSCDALHDRLTEPESEPGESGVD